MSLWGSGIILQGDSWHFLIEDHTYFFLVSVDGDGVIGSVLIAVGVLEGVHKGEQDDDDQVIDFGQCDQLVQLGRGGGLDFKVELVGIQVILQKYSILFQSGGKVYFLQTVQIGEGTMNIMTFRPLLKRKSQNLNNVCSMTLLIGRRNVRFW